MKEFKLFATLIQVAFIVMKLCGAIHWSWLLVFSPILLYLFRFVLAFFCVKHEIKQSQENFRDRMDNLKRLQQEYQDAVNKKQKELEDKRKELEDNMEQNNKQTMPDFEYTLWKKSKEQTSFKPFGKVLVRNSGFHKWRPAIFVQTRIGESQYKYNALLLSTGHVGDFTQCIPYEGNEKLAFTAIPF